MKGARRLDLVFSRADPSAYIPAPSLGPTFICDMGVTLAVSKRQPKMATVLKFSQISLKLHPAEPHAAFYTAF
jgi:hypothetical protein